MVSQPPTERSRAKGGLWSAIPTTSRSLDVSAIFCPEADRVGLSWPESPMGRPPGRRPTPRTTSGKARTGLLGEGRVHMSSPCTTPLEWAWPEGKHTASCPARGALAHLYPERQGERGRTKGALGRLLRRNKVHFCHTESFPNKIHRTVVQHSFPWPEFLSRQEVHR